MPDYFVDVHNGRAMQYQARQRGLTRRLYWHSMRRRCPTFPRPGILRQHNACEPAHIASLLPLSLWSPGTVESGTVESRLQPGTEHSQVKA